MRTKTLAAALAGLSLLLAACGGDDDTGAPSDSPTDGALPTTVAPPASGAPTTDAASATDAEATAPDTATGVPERIVSLSPTLTELMFAIGADDLLVAVDSFSYYPEAALDLPHELSAYEPNVEAIAGYEPDLVLISGDFTGLGDQLAGLDVAVWDGPAAVTLDDVWTEIEQLGALTGHAADAAELVTSMQDDIDEIVAGLPEPPAEPLTYYHELGTDLYSVTSNTFIGQIYAMVGLENIADAADDTTDYPQLNNEYIVEADPDLIFLAGGDADEVSARDGWDSITAVADGDVVELDPDIASRWGPRVVDFLQVVADAATAAGT